MDVVTYALLKKKITSALSGVKSISLSPDGKSLIFDTNDGKSFTITIPEKELVYTGSTAPDPSNYDFWIDTSESGGTAVYALTQDLTVTNPVGAATTGKVYTKGTSLETVIRDMLTT